MGHKSGRQNDDGEAQPLSPEHIGGQHSTDAYLVKSEGEPGGMAPPEWASGKSRSEILENRLDRLHSTPECFQVVLCWSLPSPIVCGFPADGLQPLQASDIQLKPGLRVKAAFSQPSVTGGAGF